MNMLYGIMGENDVPADENVVRMTTAPVDITKPAAVADDAPVMGKYESDSDPMLGMANRTLASEWHQGEKYAPSWADNVDQQALNSDRINGQVSSSGTAAQREEAGMFGHGTMSYAVGIEPVQGLAPGGQFGNEYFARDKPNIQSGMGSYMGTPPGYSHGQVVTNARLAELRAREATQSSLYEAFLFNGGN